MPGSIIRTRNWARNETPDPYLNSDDQLVGFPEPAFSIFAISDSPSSGAERGSRADASTDRFRSRGQSHQQSPGKSARSSDPSMQALLSCMQYFLPACNVKKRSMQSVTLRDNAARDRGMVRFGTFELDSAVGHSRGWSARWLRAEVRRQLRARGNALSDNTRRPAFRFLVSNTRFQICERFSTLERLACI
jgi:hypothetical protein